MSKLFKDKSGQYWSTAPDDMAKPGCKPVYTQGGGFLHQIPVEIFDRDFVEVQGFSEGISKGKLSIDASETFEGYCGPIRWNGWATPCFEKAEMLRIVQSFNTPDYPIRFDEATQAVICYMQGEDDEDPEIYPKQSLEFGGQTLEVWALGSGSWCWDFEKI